MPIILPNRVRPVSNGTYAVSVQTRRLIGPKTCFACRSTSSRWTAAWNCIFFNSTASGCGRTGSLLLSTGTGGAQPRRDQYCSVWCGGFAATPNRTVFFLREPPAPAPPDVWVTHSPEGEGGNGASWRHTRSVCRQDAPCRFPRPLQGRGLGGGVIRAANSSVQCKVKLVILKPCLSKKEKHERTTFHP